MFFLIQKINRIFFLIFALRSPKKRRSWKNSYGPQQNRQILLSAETDYNEVWGRLKKIPFPVSDEPPQSHTVTMTIGSVFWLVTALIHYQSTRWTHWDISLWLLFVLKTPSARRLTDTHLMAPGPEVREGWRGQIPTHCSRSKAMVLKYIVIRPTPPSPNVMGVQVSNASAVSLKWRGSISLESVFNRETALR